MTFASLPAGSSPDDAAPFSSQSMSDRKAQYAAWKERMMSRTKTDEVIDLVDPEPSPWSVESLFRDGI